MKFQVFKTIYGAWRFTNLATVGGDCDTWAEAYAEAHSLAVTMSVGAA